MVPNTNHNATPPTYGLEAFGFLVREALRIRIDRRHAPASDDEPVALTPGTLPEYETGIPTSIQYDGDGRIPEDLLGHPARKNSLLAAMAEANETLEATQ